MEEREVATKVQSNIKLWALVGAVCVVLGGLGVGIGIILGRTTTPPIPQAVRSAAKFPLYYPSPLPASYTVDSANTFYDSHNSAVLIPFHLENGHQIVLTEQAAPKSLDFQELLGKGKVIDSTVGDAAISNVEGRNVASMLSADHKTLVIINSETATADELTKLMQSLHPLR